MACNGACNRIMLDCAACNLHVKERVMHVIGGAACNAPCNRCNYTVITSITCSLSHYMHDKHKHKACNNFSILCNDM